MKRDEDGEKEKTVEAAENAQSLQTLVSGISLMEYNDPVTRHPRSEGNSYNRIRLCRPQGSLFQEN